MPRFDGKDKYVACASCSHVIATTGADLVTTYRCSLGLGFPRCVVLRRGKRSPGGKPWRTNVYECQQFERGE